MTHQRIVVKVGTSTLAHPTGLLNIRRVEELCKVLSDLKNAGHEIILVSSGAIGMGVGKLSLATRPSDIPTKQAAAAVGQCELMYTYDKLFSEHNHTVAQILLTAYDVDHPDRFENFRNTMHRLLELKALPIINENDTVATEELGIGDNDTLGAIVAVSMEADLLILLSDIDGLYTDNPRTHADAKIIPVVDNIDKHIYEIAGDAGSSMGTGGMYTKIQAASIATAADVDMVIASGSEDGIISRICAGEEVGTLFKAKETPLHSKKRWLVSGSKAQGRLIVDEGCRNAIIDRGSSLLPVGITAVEGIFDEGDIVSVVYDGLTIAKGISNYSSVNINAIKGLQSADIPKVLGHNGIYEEVIHRDNLVAMY